MYISTKVGLSPLPVTVTNEGLYGFPTKNVIILVVTVTGWGVDLIYRDEIEALIRIPIAQHIFHGMLAKGFCLLSWT